MSTPEMNRYLSFFSLLFMLLLLPSCISFMHKHPTVSHMNHEQATDGYNAYRKSNDTFSALKYVDRMIQTCTNQELLRTLHLERAELLMKDGNVTQAAQAFRDFFKRYPGDSRSADAHHKAIICTFNQTLAPTRDQQKTEMTLDLIKEYLTNTHYEHNEHALQEITGLQQQCYDKLAQAELAVIDCYLKQSRLQSATNRIALFETEQLPRVPHLRPELLCRRCENTRQLYQNTHDELQLEQLTQLVVELQAISPQHLRTISPDVIALLADRLPATDQLQTKRPLANRF